MHILFEFFENTGINEKELFNIKKWSEGKLNKLIHDIKLLDINAKPNNNSFFRFVGNEQFSAGRIPCSELSCRLKQADNVGLFSALYSDITYIHNPFIIYGYGDKWSLGKKQALFDDLTLIFYLKPLINFGLIQFCKGYLQLCNGCREKLVKEFLDENISIQNSIFNNSKFILKKGPKKPYIHIKSNDDLFGHNNYLLYGKTKSLEKLLRKKANTHKLSRSEMLESEFLKEIIEERILDMILQNRNAELYDCNYINSSNFSMNIVNLLNNPDLNSKYNNINIDTNHSVPVILNTDFNNLIKFRENEFEAFLVYRDALQSIINQKSGDYRIDWNEMFNDIIRPEINKMNLAIKNSKSIFRRKGLTEIAVGTGLLSFGLFSGLLPNNSTDLLSILGGCEFVKGVIENLSSARSTPLEIKDNRFYFIWKLQSKK